MNLPGRARIPGLCLALVALVGCETVGLDQITGGEEATQKTLLGDITYTAGIVGLPDDKGLDEVARGVLKTFTLQSRGVRSTAALQRRADGDIGAHRAWIFQKRQSKRIGRNDANRLLCMQRGHFIREITEVSMCSRILNAIHGVVFLLL